MKNTQKIITTLLLGISSTVFAYGPPFNLEKGIQENELLALKNAVKISPKIIQLPSATIQHDLLDGEMILQYSPPTGLCGFVVFSKPNNANEIIRRYRLIQGGLDKKYGRSRNQSSLKTSTKSDQVFKQLLNQKTLKHVWSGNTRNLLQFNLSQIVLSVTPNPDAQTGQIMLAYLFNNFQTCEKHKIDEFDIPGL
ncbi:MAG: hypothetical protein KGV48_001520 [Alcaligenaceae bacterium]|nr:hypothetical protein [Alcaligenaceae bacterium]